MGKFEFRVCVKDQAMVYCVDHEGHIYKMTMPKKTPVEEVPARVIEAIIREGVRVRK
jgi:hypothetical protein